MFEKCWQLKLVHPFRICYLLIMSLLMRFFPVATIQILSCYSPSPSLDLKCKSKPSKCVFWFVLGFIGYFWVFLCFTRCSLRPIWYNLYYRPVIKWVIHIVYPSLKFTEGTFIINLLHNWLFKICLYQSYVKYLRDGCSVKLQFSIVMLYCVKPQWVTVSVYQTPRPLLYWNYTPLWLLQVAMLAS